jgi:hypothetical protein
MTNAMDDSRNLFLKEIPMEKYRNEEGYNVTRWHDDDIAMYLRTERHQDGSYYCEYIDEEGTEEKTGANHAAVESWVMSRLLRFTVIPTLVEKQSV